MSLNPSWEGDATGQVLPFRAEHFSWLLGSLCQAHRLPFDAALLLNQFPPPQDPASLHEAARALGLRSDETTVLDRAQLESLPLPVVAFLRADRPVLERSAEALNPVIILSRDEQRFVYVSAGSGSPRARLLGDFFKICEPRVLLFSAQKREQPAELVEPQGKFGFRWFARELARHKNVWSDVLITSLALQLVGLATPLFTQIVVDRVVMHHARSTLVAIAIGMAICVLFTALFSWMRQYLTLHTGTRVDAVLASGALRHALRLPLAYYEQRSTGVTVARLQALDTIREFVTGAGLCLLLDLPFLIVIVAVMLVYSVPLTLAALVIALLLVALSVGVTPLLRSRLNEQFLLGARNQAFLTEYVAGIETVKTLQLEPVLERRYDNYLADYLNASFATRRLGTGFQVCANALEQLMTLAILVAGALLVMNNDGFTIGMLVAFQMFAARMTQPMMRIASLWQEFQQASVAVQRLGDVMNAPAEPFTLAPRTVPGGACRLEVRGLSFRHGEERSLLYRDWSFSVRPGSLVAVTGSSGSGKSTLVKLLLGFYRPSEGRVLIDGVDIQGLAANELRLAFGVVPQETVLFAGTVLENLLMASPGARFAQVVAACTDAEIHDVVQNLPKGYETRIGEHGVGLSGGQRQRLAIARALLKKPRILVFDEATSSLDSATAERLAQTINRLRGRATILFIAHAVPQRLEVDEVLAIPKAAP